MRAAVGVEHVSSEKVSCVAAKRPELERVLDELKAGMVVTKLDPGWRARGSNSSRVVELIREAVGSRTLRNLGRHHVSGQADDHGADRRRRTRAQVALAEDQRGPSPRHGRRQEPQAVADQVQARETLKRVGGGRAVARDRPASSHWVPEVSRRLPQALGSDRQPVVWQGPVDP